MFVVDLKKQALQTHIACLQCVYAGYSLLYRRGLLKVDDFMSPLISAVASSWAETLFLVQLSKSPGVLEASANVLLEIGAPLDIISWFKGMLRCVPRYVFIYVCTVRTYVHNIETLAYTYSHMHLQYVWTHTLSHTLIHTCTYSMYGYMHIRTQIHTDTFCISLSVPSDVLPSSYILLCRTYACSCCLPGERKPHCKGCLLLSSCHLLQENIV